jgi:hypothetical protein
MTARPTGAPRDLFGKRIRKPPPALEVRTHIAISDLLAWSAAPGWFWSHIGHGGHRSEQTGALLKRMGLKRGLFDFLLIAPDGRHHWLELKRGSAPLTPEQSAFHDDMTARGVACAIARSFDEAVEQLRSWGAIRDRVRLSTEGRRG